VQSAVSSFAYTVKSGTTSVSCAAGKTLLSGGGVVSTTDTLDKVRLTSSYPSAANTWTVVGSALVLKGKTWSVKAYAICG
jgi:hypothetical protein